MAVALSSIGVIFGYGIGTLTSAPSTFKEIEDCVSIGGVEKTADNLDATTLKSKTKQYIRGHEDTGGELPTTFNVSDTFDAQWAELLSAYQGLSDTQVIWFCAYHPSRAKMDVYIVQPGTLPRPEYSVGGVLQYKITNTLIDVPAPITKIKPTLGE